MDESLELDVPYGDDWDSAAEVAAWAEAADQKRPWRSQIRDHIADRVAKLPSRARDVHIELSMKGLVLYAGEKVV